VDEEVIAATGDDRRAMAKAIAFREYLTTSVVAATETVRCSNRRRLFFSAFIRFELPMRFVYDEVE